MKCDFCNRNDEFFEVMVAPNKFKKICRPCAEKVHDAVNEIKK